MNYQIFFFILLFCSTNIWAQISFDETEQQETGQHSIQTSKSERILRISPYKKILIISNNTDYLNEGDYFSLIYKDKLAGRFLAIKKKNEKIGVKVIKISDFDSFNMLMMGSEVGLLKGDFSKFKSREQETNNDVNSSSLESEVVSVKDILDEADQVSIDDDTKREIRTDNIISAAYGQINSIDGEGGKKAYQHWALQWSHQFIDNFWGEVTYGQSSMKDFPGSDTGSTLHQIIARAKYTLSAPLNIYIQPYIGLRYTKINAPDATSTMSEDQKKAESARVSEAEKKDLIFGATLLKRLVPGWFVKADVGIDIINAGISFEF